MSSLVANNIYRQVINTIKGPILVTNQYKDRWLFNEELSIVYFLKVYKCEWVIIKGMQHNAQCYNFKCKYLNMYHVKVTLGHLHEKENMWVHIDTVTHGKGAGLGMCESNIGNRLD